ncbi:MAG: tyrosine-type recombinase/integrase [Hyphomicrobiales bacterium]
MIDTLPKTTFIWDDTLKGFGVKVYPTGRIVFVLQGRLNGGSRRYTIGQYGSPWSPDQARAQALNWLSELSQGNDPTAERRAKKLEGKLSDIIDDYMQEVSVRKKQNTQNIESSLIKRHIVPLLGKRRISELTKRDIQKFMLDVANGKTAKDIKTKPRGRAIVTGGKGTANRSVAVLSSLINYSVDLGLREDNPAIGVKKYKLKTHDRYLTSEELDRLGEALRTASMNNVSPFAIAAIRFLILTGCRAGEALNLQWGWIDWDHNLAKLPDSKTGQKPLMMGDGAMALLKTLPRIEGTPLVFASAVGGTTPLSIKKVWIKVRKLADIEDVRIHDLRHNFASQAVSSGQSLYMVGKLLGHSQSQTTQRYAHLAPDPIKQAANDVSNKLAERIGG